MGFLDDLKHKAGELGDKAKDGFEVAKDKASDLAEVAKDKAGNLVGDVQDRIGGDDEPTAAPTTESADISSDAPETRGFTVTDNRGPVDPG